MSLFSSSNICNYFEQIHSTIKNKINSYDYRQLRDFSEAELNSFIEYYSEPNIEVDFDNPRMEIRNGKGEIYNYDSEIFEREPKYISVDGKYIRFFSKVKGTSYLLRYDLFERDFETINYYDENYNRMELEKDKITDCFCVSFELFIPDIKLENKTQAEIQTIVNNEKNVYIKTTLLKINRLNALINSFNKNLKDFIQETINKKIKDDSSLEFVSSAIGINVIPKNENQNKGTKIEILPKTIDLMLPDRKKYNGYYE